MPLVRVIAVIAWLPILVEPVLGSAPGGASAPATSDVLAAFTRQSAFTIPFRIEPAQAPQQQPAEVQLHVSTDAGAQWEAATAVKPEKGAFIYRAPRDGEYWFAIRTVDSQGTARPEGNLAPQLKVTVDTVAPRLELTATRGAAGEIVARWRAVDPHLKLASFKLQYQAGTSDPWERVAVESPPPAMRHTYSGETTWWPSTPGATAVVQAEITDQAGNPAVSQAFVKAAPPAAPGEVARSLPATVPPAAGNYNPPSPPGDAGRWTADRLTDEPLGRAAAGQPPAAQPSNWRMAGTRASGPVEGTDGAGPQPPRGGPPGSPLDFSRLPPGARPSLLASRSFELEYEVDSIGPSGVAKVELWGTRDAGATWSVFGVDADNRSPLQVTVDGEGLFGFRVVVHSGSGLGSRAPSPGDAPDVWIGVDLTRPTCTITRSDVAAEAGELTVEWQAHDDVPDVRPISLSYATAAGGPWTAVASGLENTGRYTWRLDTSAPDHVYLRLDMRDAAGNVGSFESPQPISLDRRRPEGRIRGVRPLSG